MRTRAAIGTLATLALLAAGCGSSMSGTKRDNVAYLYGRTGASVQLRARVHHASLDRSTLHYKIATRDLLYKSDGAGGPFQAVVRVGYEAYPEWNSRTLLDSASTVVVDTSGEPGEDKELIGSMDLRHIGQRSFVLRVVARDLNRESQGAIVVRVDRDGPGARQNFLPLDPATGLPLFDDHLPPGRAVRVRCDLCEDRPLIGTRHPVDPALPSPVFTTSRTASTGSAPADSVFTLAVDPATGTYGLEPGPPGVHHLRTDTADEKGFTLFVLTEAYPYVGTGADMLKPLRYITSMQEYERISTSAEPRRAIERFWLDAAGDRERAREAIRVFYGRVENANRWFTGQVEGWRTDRGLVHIIFGAPNHIHRSDLSETWTFGEENNLMSLTFTFTKRPGPFTDNDFVLDRDPTLKGAWYRNVEAWRNGRVYQN